MPLSPVIVPPRAQASRRCETQAPLSGKPPSCAKRFGPLTPSARSGNLIVGDGTKNGLPAPNKELAINRKQPLDRKSPIQVRIHLPPAGSRVRTRFPESWSPHDLQLLLDTVVPTVGRCGDVRFRALLKGSTAWLLC